MAFFIIILSDSFVLILAGCVPNLQFDLHAINLDNVEDVVDADSHHVVFDKLALTVPEKDVAFANSGIPNDNDLPEVVVLLGLGFLLPHDDGLCFHSNLCLKIN